MPSVGLVFKSFGLRALVVSLTGCEASKQVAESLLHALLLLPAPVLHSSHACVFGPG